MREARSDNIQDDWWVEAFDDLYPLLYGHRDESEAERLLEQIAGLGSLAEGPLLDLGCGAGRHLRALRRHRLQGIGLDYSWSLLKHARQTGCTEPLVRGDMRSLPFRRGSFRWILMMFTTFGYFKSDEENRRVLRSAADLLRPGGRLVLDYLNSGTLHERLVERSSRTIPGYRVEERRWIDGDGPFVCKETRLEPTAAGQRRRYRERVRLYEPREVERLLAMVGLAIVSRLGDYDGATFEEAASPRLILIARTGGGVA